MKRFVIFTLALVVLALSRGDVAAQKKGKEKEAETLAKSLKTEKDAKKRLEAAQKLYEIAEIKVSYVKPHVPLLVEALKSDGDANVRVAAGNVLLICEPDGKDVIPIAAALVKNDKENGAVLAVSARLLSLFGKDAAEAIPALQEIKKREEAKEDPKTRDQALVQAVTQAIQSLGK